MTRPSCNVAGKLAMQDWLGIHYPENIYYGSNHCPAQILRNCVHPLLGAQILAAARMPNGSDQARAETDSAVRPTRPAR